MTALLDQGLKKTRRAPSRALLSALLIFLILPLSELAAQAPTETETRERLRELKQRMTSLQRSLVQSKGARGEQLKALQVAEVAIGKLNQDLKKTRIEQKRLQTRLSSLSSRRTKLNQDRLQQEAQIAAQVRSAYRLGQEGNIKLLLNQDSPQRVSRLLKYYDYIIAARAEKLAAYTEILIDIDEVKTSINIENAALARNQQDLLSQKRALSQQQDSRKHNLAKLNASIADKDKQLQQMQADQSNLQRVLEELRLALEELAIESSNVVAQQGKLRYPVAGRITQTFGSSRAGGKMRWDGLVFRADSGTAVSAIHNGQVVFSDYLKGYGLLLIVDHGDSYMSLYAHSESLLKDTGDWVEAGELIATAGNSGGQAHSGLYFELRHKGKPINPARWFNKG